MARPTTRTVLLALSVLAAAVVGASRRQHTDDNAAADKRKSVLSPLVTGSRTETDTRPQQKMGVAAFDCDEDEFAPDKTVSGGGVVQRPTTASNVLVARAVPNTGKVTSRKDSPSNVSLSRLASAGKRAMQTTHSESDLVTLGGAGGKQRSAALERMQRQGILFVDEIDEMHPDASRFMRTASLSNESKMPIFAGSMVRKKTASGELGIVDSTSSPSPSSSGGHLHRVSSRGFGSSGDNIGGSHCSTPHGASISPMLIAQGQNMRVEYLDDDNVGASIGDDLKLEDVVDEDAEGAGAPRAQMTDQTDALIADLERIMSSK